MKTDNRLYADMGRRIRERRKRLGLTQTQLCGDYMTRNMLSRIETGDAHPSLETLLFISQKLKTPPSFFLCRDAKEEAEYTKTVKIKDARRFLGTGQYKKCIDICQELPSDDDEVSAMEANAYIMAAIEHFDKGELHDAHKYLANASTALHSTVYLYNEMISQIKLLKILISSLARGILPSSHALPKALPVFFTKDRYLYILSLSLSSEGKSCDNGLSELIENEAYTDHLRAIQLLERNEHSDALPLLEKALNNAPNSFCFYFILCDLERCCKECEDYKKAYGVAEQRNALHEKYSQQKQD